MNEDPPGFDWQWEHGYSRPRPIHDPRILGTDSPCCGSKVYEDPDGDARCLGCQEVLATDPEADE